MRVSLRGAWAATLIEINERVELGSVTRGMTVMEVETTLFISAKEELFVWSTTAMGVVFVVEQEKKIVCR